MRAVTALAAAARCPVSAPLPATAALPAFSLCSAIIDLPPVLTTNKTDPATAARLNRRIFVPDS